MPTVRADILALDPGSPGVPLDVLGWSVRWAEEFGGLADDGFLPARVVRVDRGMPVVASAECVERAEPATHLIKTAGESASRAVIGDWVALSHPEGHDLAIIEAILPRISAFSRKDPGEETGVQVLIANVDIVFVVQSLSGHGVNLRRLERELVLTHESGATPVVVLSKADLCGDCETPRAEAQAVALGVDVIVESAITGIGLADVRARIAPGVTAALLGESGVGKSTMINRLLESDALATAAVRVGDDKGRHTTVAREMISLPEGGVIIDTPGMRALALWDAEAGMAAAFADVLALAECCKFRDCTHTDEPGCAVRAAVESGELPAQRLASFLALRAELDELVRRQEEAGWAEKDRTPKSAGKHARSHDQHSKNAKNRHRKDS